MNLKKQIPFLLLIAAAAALPFTACSKDDDDKDHNSDTPTRSSRIVKTEKFFSEDSPYNVTTDYSYDANGRLSQVHILNAKGTEYENETTLSYVYADNQITVDQDGQVFFYYHLNNSGLIESYEVVYDGETRKRAAMHYDDQGHLQMMVYDGLDSTCYVWQGNDVVQQNSMNNSSGSRNVYQIDFTLSDVAFSAFPFTAYYGTGEMPLAAFGYFGTQPAHLNSHDVMGSTEYLYEYVVENGRATQMKVSSNSVLENFTMYITWE